MNDIIVYELAGMIRRRMDDVLAAMETLEITANGYETVVSREDAERIAAHFGKKLPEPVVEEVKPEKKKRTTKKKAEKKIDTVAAVTETAETMTAELKQTVNEKLDAIDRKPYVSSIIDSRGIAKSIAFGTIYNDLPADFYLIVHTAEMKVKARIRLEEDKFLDMIFDPSQCELVFRMGEVYTNCAAEFIIIDNIYYFDAYRILRENGIEVTVSEAFEGYPGWCENGCIKDAFLEEHACYAGPFGYARQMINDNDEDIVAKGFAAQTHVCWLELMPEAISLGSKEIDAICWMTGNMANTMKEDKKLGSAIMNACRQKNALTEADLIKQLKTMKDIWSLKIYATDGVYELSMNSPFAGDTVEISLYNGSKWRITLYQTMKQAKDWAPYFAKILMAEDHQAIGKCLMELGN